MDPIISKPIDESLLLVDTANPNMPTIYIHRMKRLSTECSSILLDPEFQQQLKEKDILPSDGIRSLLHQRGTGQVGFFLGEVSTHLDNKQIIHYSYVDQFTSIYISNVLRKYIKTPFSKFQIRVFDTIQHGDVRMSIHKQLLKEKEAEQLLKEKEAEQLLKEKEATNEDDGMIVCFVPCDPQCTLAMTGLNGEPKACANIIDAKTDWFYKLLERAPQRSLKTVYSSNTIDSTNNSMKI